MSTAQHIAAIARARGPLLSERIRLQSDELSAALAQELQMVAWDREQLVGRLQTRTAALHRTRPMIDEGPPLLVVERRRQPLESIDVAWGWLRKGRRVRLELEPGACTVAAGLLRAVAESFPPDVLIVGEAGEASPEHLDGGVHAPGPRVAVVDADADRELAAYVLARTGLRRSGVDPRRIRIAYVVGDLDLLARHMRRLWVGVQVGPADDPESFAGPVPASTRDAFLACHAQWQAHDDVEMWCQGGVLDRAGDEGNFLAPAVFCVPGGVVPPLPIDGPLVVVVACDSDATLRQEAASVRAEGGAVVQIGGQPGLVPQPARHVRGALLVERLPPGLPEPRPV